MALYTEPNEVHFARLEARHRWFPAVLEAEYGESDLPEELPETLNWLLKVPLERRYDFEDMECGLAYISPDGGYACTVWDVSGEEDDPWAVFVVDDYGARLLLEYSVLDEDADEATRETALRRAAEEIPIRAESGEFTRSGTALTIPDWLNAN